MCAGVAGSRRPGCFWVAEEVNDTLAGSLARRQAGAVSGRGLPGRRLIVGVCRLGCGAEQTRALCDSWHATGEPLVSAAHSFLPANEEARLLVLDRQQLALIFFSPHIVASKRLGSICCVLFFCCEMEITRTGGKTGRCEREFVYEEETLHPVF